MTTQQKLIQNKLSLLELGDFFRVQLRKIAFKSEKSHVFEVHISSCILFNFILCFSFRIYSSDIGRERAGR